LHSTHLPCRFPYHFICSIRVKGCDGGAALDFGLGQGMVDDEVGAAAEEGFVIGVGVGFGVGRFRRFHLFGQVGNLFLGQIGNHSAEL
jgi:hypothetical protein